VSVGAKTVGLAGVSVGLDISSIGICALKGDSLNMLDSDCLTGFGEETGSVGVDSLASTSAGFVASSAGKADMMLVGGC